MVAKAALEERLPQLYCPTWLAPVIPTDPLAAAKGPRGCQEAPNRAN